MSSEGESGQHGCTSSSVEEHGERIMQESNTSLLSSAKDAQGIRDFLPIDGAHAVKQRLALRLSERRQNPMGSFDEGPTSLDLWSKGSTESGYFSRSDSGEWSQTSPPNTEAKSYAEIILGKFGRLDQWHRNPHQQCPGSSEPVERRRGIPLNVPATQVIEHITKLITINEALIDTREIDSVKPRRSSLSRKSSIEVPRISAPKASVTNSSNSVDVGFSRDPVHPRFLRVGLLATRLYTAPLVRSHSMPSPAGAVDCTARRFRFSHSFDEWQPLPAGKRVGRHHGILRRQPALEVPVEPEPILQEVPHRSSVTTVMPSSWQSQYVNTHSARQTESKTYISHRQGQESLRANGSGFPTGYLAEDPNSVVRKEVLIQRLHKRQEETRQEHEVDACKVQETVSPFTPTSTSTGRKKRSAIVERLCRESEALQSAVDSTNSGKGISVIQHTSSFEKKEKVFSAFSQNKDHQAAQAELPKSHSHSLLVRQPSIQVPEVLFMEEPDGSAAKSSSMDTVFQWPKRSSTLAQLPAEKLPPKKKCLRLAEAAHTTGESCLSSLPSDSSVNNSTSILHTCASHDKMPQVDTELLLVTASGASQMTHTMTALSHPQHLQTLASYSGQGVDLTESSSSVENRAQICHPVRDPTCGASDQNKSSFQTSREVILQVRPTNPSPAMLLTHFNPSPASHSNPKIMEQSATSSVTSASPKSVTDSSTACLPYGANPEPMELSQYPVSSSCSIRSVVSQRRFLPKPAFSLLSLKKLSDAGAKQPVLQKESRLSPSLLQSQIPFLRDPLSPDTASSGLLRPVNVLAVPVRTQTPVARYGRAVYTARSQVSVLRDKDPICSAVSKRELEEACPNPYLVIPTPVQSHQVTLLPLKPGTQDSKKGSKNALAPVSCFELSPGGEPQNKRVKREQENHCSDKNDEVGGGGAEKHHLITDKPHMSKWNVEEDVQAQEVDSKESGKESVMGKTEASVEELEDNSQRNILRVMSSDLYPCLHTATSVSWCFLKNLNSSTQRETQTSVYSAQCSSLPGLNSLGLSTRAALSLLHSKQKHRPEVYTTACTPQSSTRELLPACKPEVHERDVQLGNADESEEEGAAISSGPAEFREPTPVEE